MFDRIRDRLGSAESGKYEVDRKATTAAFEALLDDERVTVDGDRATTVEEFDEIVVRYDEISDDVEEAMDELTDDGEMPGIYFAKDNTELDRWQRENPELVAEIESLYDRLGELTERLDVDESSIDGDGPTGEADEFYQALQSAHWLTK